MKLKIIFIIAILLLSIHAVAAQNCETAIIKSALRKALFDYFDNPPSAQMSVEKLRDLLNFYLTIPDQNIIVNCAVQGGETGIKMHSIVNEADRVVTEFPPCVDGTIYGECSDTRPQYCYSGELLDKCSICGCPAGLTCSDNTCIEQQVENYKFQGIWYNAAATSEIHLNAPKTASL